MKTSYLEYYKLILDKVSFDSALWKKEYQKALSLLNPQEAFLLKNWARNKYYPAHRKLAAQSEKQHNGIPLKPSRQTKVI
ncbi:hypothetical protein GCM10028791_37820 [Echinicola sediminis]